MPFTLRKNYGEDVWHQFAEANPDIATRLAFSQIQLSRTQVLGKFEEMLRDESLSEGEWQSFFDENKWIVLLFKAAWSFAKVVAIILFTVALPALVFCFLLIGGVFLLIPVGLLAVSLVLLSN